MIRALALLGALSLGFFGCDDDDADGGGADAAASGGEGGEGGGAAGEGGGAGGEGGGLGGEGGEGGDEVNTTQEYFCEPTGEAVCQNEGDCDLLESGDAKEEALDCGRDCLGTPPEDMCTSLCIIERIGTTPDCAACLDQFFACIVERCVGPCVAGTNAECTECSRNKPTPEESCSQAFFDCSGATLNPDYIIPE